MKWELIIATGLGVAVGMIIYGFVAKRMGLASSFESDYEGYDEL